MPHAGQTSDEPQGLSAAGRALEKRLELPALTAGRADIITQGLDIAVTVLQGLQTPALTVSTTDLLFGQLLELVAQ